MVSETKAIHNKDVVASSVNHQLYQVLCLNLEGKALTMIKNLSNDTTTNGIIGWCKLAQECSSMTAQPLQNLAVRAYQPKRCKTYAEVSAAIEE